MSVKGQSPCEFTHDLFSVSLKSTDPVLHFAAGSTALSSFDSKQRASENLA